MAAIRDEELALMACLTAGVLNQQQQQQQQRTRGGPLSTFFVAPNIHEP